MILDKAEVVILLQWLPWSFLPLLSSEGRWFRRYRQELVFAFQPSYCLFPACEQVSCCLLLLLTRETSVGSSSFDGSLVLNLKRGLEAVPLAFRPKSMAH
jgi:hypothetical protein